MPLFEVILRSRTEGQQTINRFNYVGSGTPAAVSMSFALTSALGAVEVAGAFPAGTVMNILQDVQTDSVSYDEIQVRDVYSNTDFYLLPFEAGTTGNVETESMSPVMSFGFRTNRVRTDIRRGTRRFGGVAEAAVGAGGFIVPAWLGYLEALAEAMTDNLVYSDEGNTLTFTPCVVGRWEDTSPAGNPVYKYYETFTEQVDHLASGVIWTPYDTVRTQVSRQYGRGR